MIHKIKTWWHDLLLGWVFPNKSFHYSPMSDTFTINGIRYAGSFFKDCEKLMFMRTQRFVTINKTIDGVIFMKLGYLKEHKK